MPGKFPTPRSISPSPKNLGRHFKSNSKISRIPFPLRTLVSILLLPKERKSPSTHPLICLSDPMAVPHNATTEGDPATEDIKNPAEASPTAVSSPSKHNKSLGVRVAHGRTYDSENGKSCHQVVKKIFVNPVSLSKLS